jgi:hypothetical protein
MEVRVGGGQSSYKSPPKLMSCLVESHLRDLRHAQTNLTLVYLGSLVVCDLQQISQNLTELYFI